MGFLARIGNGFKKTGIFFRDCWLELKKVRWPNRKEMINYTTVVVVTVAFMTVYFAIIDLGLSSLLRLFFGN
ncbi:preprotein translocase, SecE subunit [Caldalkalibacillus thermarum TA2.A1]|uniref:Protein translocase subunit SecE n=1 Tax=Caldalkalibacillus thermarum (strain TA2.A1) TaxID=986075 RepID=F5L354_CALTT|nr:preprotein translocase subunit SecE [Caldalkalibacillus thermarum]EGL84224.1 preprotein translocase, SecE subunit [Caldalkalibacillus thermarum TA2.A1]QZT34406.1 preprotein translocase subunit SecE [Caldalkalibacillus thermarum TA2.A1]